MSKLELWLLILTAMNLVVGLWGVFWARAGRKKSQISWGRALFVAALFATGVLSATAAFHHSDGLVPGGLTVGFLMVVMLWEGPPPSWYGAMK